jgi:predicted dehydrogenase
MQRRTFYVSDTTKGGVTRREAIKTTGTLAVASALAGVTIPNVHAADKNTIQVALVGCGGRGTGAAGDALSTKSGSLKLVAMADVFHDHLSSSYKNLKESFPAQVDVPPERQFIGFDGYKHAMDCLQKGDVAIFATPPAFRWVHFQYAIEKGLNVFMEKPVTVDGPSSRRMYKLAEESEKKNMKVGVGLMCRHCVVRGELFKRIKQGELGDIVLLRAYRQAGPTASAFSKPKPYSISELLYQIQRFHSFLWASGGAFSDFLIHNIDECCWMKDAWPIQAKGSGGRHYRADYIDQNFDSYSVEYTFADGSKLQLEGRTMAGCTSEFASYAHGTKASAVISTNSHFPAYSRIYKGQHLGSKQNLVWQWGKREDEPNPYKLEWDDLVAAIRQDKQYNEAKRGIEASLVTCMGRMAAHTGQIITRDQMLNCDHEFAPDVDKLTLEGGAPLTIGENGKYPIPEPGIKTKREY